jgi:hypothetical protein
MDRMSSVPPKWTPNYKQATQFEAWRLAEMIHLLPAAICDPNTSELLKQAALECFFTHVRTLIEFLGGVRPKDHLDRDRSAQDTLTNANWTPSLDEELKGQLDKYWVMASEHLVHFSKNRVIDDHGLYVQPLTDPRDLEAIADDVLEVWDQYATESDDLLVPHRARFAVSGQYTRMRWPNQPDPTPDLKRRRNRWLNCLIRGVRTFSTRSR